MKEKISPADEALKFCPGELRKLPEVKRWEGW